MKTLRLSILALLMLGAFSCKKDASTSASTTVTTDDVADVAAGSLSSHSNGLASMTDAVSANAQAVASAHSGLTINSTGVASVKQECGTTIADSASNAGSADSVSFSYFVKYTHTLNCNSQSEPDNIVNTLTYHGSYDGPNVSSTNTGSANVTIAGLTTSASQFVLNGEYKRAGTFNSKVGNKAAFTSNVDIVATNVTLTKPGRKISGGSATISITGTSPKGSFSYTGTIVFNGDGSATLTINGKIYTIDLKTGYRLLRK